PPATEGSVPKVTELMLQSNRHMTPDDFTFPNNTSPQKQVPMWHWGTQEYDPSLVNAWFTDGSATTRNNKVHWKAAAFRPGDGLVITESGPER
ncbi:hypothetical protein ACQP3J_29580, partial [Escherichia coli]